jgi:hypothetical protein
MGDRVEVRLTRRRGEAMGGRLQPVRWRSAGAANRKCSKVRAWSPAA